MNNNEIELLIKEKELQVSKLYEQIAELKQQLKKEEQNIKSQLSLEQRIEIYMSYFRGRDDVYPYLSINKNNPNIKYYIPACVNEWKNGVCNKTMGKPCKTCQYKELKPINCDVIKNHIYNNKTIGIYPLLEDETCYFLAFD